MVTAVCVCVCVCALSLAVFLECNVQLLSGKPIICQYISVPIHRAFMADWLNDNIISTCEKPKLKTTQWRNSANKMFKTRNFEHSAESHFLEHRVYSHTDGVHYYYYYYYYYYSINPIIRTLVIRIANYPNPLGPSGNFVEDSAKLICLEITGYRIEYSTVKCYGCLELQIRRGGKV
jgi:hypothetical protein